MAEQAPPSRPSEKFEERTSRYRRCIFDWETAKLAKKFDSYLSGNGTVLDSPTPDIDNLNLEADADRVLNPIWRDPFLAFMDMSHLPPERLLVWARAALAAYPADPTQVDRRYPPTLEIISHWLSKMHSPKERQNRRMRIAAMEEVDAMVCFIATAPIICDSGDKEILIGTLIIGFERRSETLVHHIIRHAVNAADVLLIAQKLVAMASKRIKAVSLDTARYLVLPISTARSDWGDELRQFFRKNRRDDAGKPPNLNLPSGFTMIDQSQVVEVNLQGRRFRTRHDLWLPIDYAVSCPLPDIYCNDDQGDNQLHDLLAKASRGIRQAMKKTEGAGNSLPTWQGLSRARR